MNKTMLAVAAVLAIGFGHAAVADGMKDCTKEPQTAWKKQADAEAEAKKAGYEVRRSKVEGTCFEVYVVKDGKMFELFYNPVDLKLLLTVAK